MTREQLEHAACDISEDNELYIFGSQAILGQYPDANEQLRQSIEVDLSPKNKPEAVDKIDGTLGENSLFHQTHGFYVHGVSLKRQYFQTVGKREQTRYRIIWMSIRSAGAWKHMIWQPVSLSPFGKRIPTLSGDLSWKI